MKFAFICYEEIAKENGVSVKSIYNICKENGIKSVHTLQVGDHMATKFYKKLLKLNQFSILNNGCERAFTCITIYN